MDAIPFSAVALAIVVLLVVWFFLAHMISSRKDDARLHFLLKLLRRRHIGGQRGISLVDLANIGDGDLWRWWERLSKAGADRLPRPSR